MLKFVSLFINVVVQASPCPVEFGAVIHTKINPLWVHLNRRATDHYIAVRWWVHWPLMCGLLHLVQRGPAPAQSPRACKSTGEFMLTLVAVIAESKQNFFWTFLAGFWSPSPNSGLSDSLSSKEFSQKVKWSTQWLS